MLPTTYTELEYIENSAAGSYFKTGIIAKNNTTVEFDGYVISGDTALYGSRVTSGTQRYAVQFIASEVYKLGYGSSEGVVSTSYKKNIRYLFKQVDNTLSINGTEVATVAATTISGKEIYVLGAMNTNGAATNTGCARMYSMKIYQSNVLVRNFVPCKSSDNTVGVYDTVGNTFYANAGSSSFVGGNPVVQTTGIEVTPPTKTTYYVGDSFDSTGMVVYIVYSNGTKEETTDYTVSGFDSSSEGNKTVVVTCLGYTASFQVTIIPHPEEADDGFNKEYYNTYDQKYVDICHRSQKYPVFKIEILDYNEYVIQDVTEDLRLDEDGSISIQYQQGVHRTCEFTINNMSEKYLPSENSMFWYHRKFKLYTGLKDQATGNTYWFSQGVFFTKSISCEKKSTHISGVDKFAAFTNDLGSSLLDVDFKITVPEDGSSAPKIGKVIRDILTRDKGNGTPIDPIAPLIDNELADVEIPYDLTVSAGGFLGDMMIELAMMLGADIYYDVDGRLIVSKGTTDYLYTTQGSQWNFSLDKSDYISYTSSYDITKAINKIMVFGEGYSGIYNYVTITNDNPQSPLRVSLIGTRQGESIETAMAYSMDKCEAYGKYYLKMKSIIQLSADIECTYLPHLDVNRIITVYDEYFSKDIMNHIVQNITMPFTSQTMKISATNIALLPYYSKGVT